MTDTVAAPDKTLLIASNKVDEMAVRTREGDKLGHVYSYMVNKRTGTVTHAVLSLGGLLGLGKSYYPLPFEFLTYNAVDDVYQVTIDRKLLEGGPSWSNNAPNFDQAYADRVASYYGSRHEAVAVG